MSLHRIAFAIIMFAAISLISACAGFSEYSRRYNEAQQQRQENYTQQLRGACLGYGYIEGTSDFARCVQQEHYNNQQAQQAQQQRIDEQNRQLRESIDRQTSVLQSPAIVPNNQIQAQPMAPVQIQPIQPIPTIRNNNVNCRSYYSGGQLITNCQ